MECQEHAVSINRYYKCIRMYQDDKNSLCIRSLFFINTYTFFSCAFLIRSMSDNYPPEIQQDWGVLHATLQSVLLCYAKIFFRHFFLSAKQLNDNEAFLRTLGCFPKLVDQDLSDFSKHLSSIERQAHLISKLHLFMTQNFYFNVPINAGKLN